MSIRIVFNTLSRWLFTQRKNTAGECHKGKNAHRASGEKISGYWFCARVQLRTPFAILDKHGTFHPGPPTHLPWHGTVNEGIWLPVYLSTQSQPLPYLESDIGLIPHDGGDYLRFVKSFRQIVEAKISADMKIVQLNLLLQRNVTYQDFAKKFGPDFVTTWFVNDLLVIPGINPQKALRLFSAGYRTVEELTTARDSSLRDILQIDEATMTKIRTFVDEYAKREQGKTAA